MATLKPGGLVVESTAGNTGIGLALVANARGYRTVIVIPETQSQEKKDMLRLLRRRTGRSAGPALRQSRTTISMSGAASPTNCARPNQNGVLFADQWNNLDNRKAHYVSTGPEIWRDTDGKIDGFICSVGTGGTLAGVSTFLREKKKDIVIGCRRSPRRRDVHSIHAWGSRK